MKSVLHIAFTSIATAVALASQVNLSRAAEAPAALKLFDSENTDLQTEWSAAGSATAALVQTSSLDGAPLKACRDAASRPRRRRLARPHLDPPEGKPDSSRLDAIRPVLRPDAAVAK